MTRSGLRVTVAAGEERTSGRTGIDLLSAHFRSPVCQPVCQPTGGALRSTGTTGTAQRSAGEGCDLMGQTQPWGRREAGWTLVDRRGTPCVQLLGAPWARVPVRGSSSVVPSVTASLGPSVRKPWCSSSGRCAGRPHVSLRGPVTPAPLQPPAGPLTRTPTWLSSGMLYTSESSSMVQALNGTAWFAMVLAARQ